jgi:phage protein U
MFAVLGDILFEVVGSPEKFDSVRDYDFAEHRVVESRPRLQWVGNGLERLKLELMLHASFTDPSAQLAILKANAAAHRALPLVLGSGGFRGFFVIDSLAVRSQQSSSTGTPIAIGVTLSLKEWAAGSLAELLAMTEEPLAAVVGSASAITPKAGRTMPGVSALLRLRAATGATGPTLQAGDVSGESIVRSAAR